jgi:hypothetical protein
LLDFQNFASESLMGYCRLLSANSSIGQAWNGVNKPY